MADPLVRETEKALRTPAVGEARAKALKRDDPKQAKTKVERAGRALGER